MRWLKRLTLLLLLIVVAAGAWISTRDLNLSEWLPEIEAAVRDATGRELKVTGDLELDLATRLGLFELGRDARYGVDVRLRQLHACKGGGYSYGAARNQEVG